MLIIDWIKNLFHVHTKITISRKLLERVFVDTTVDHGHCDLQPANVYLYKRRCLKCNKDFSEIKTVLEIFDRTQPCDKNT